MALIKTKCPSCGEIVQVDSTKQFSFCMSCGAKVERTTDNDSNGIGFKKAIENYYSLATHAYSAKNFTEAEAYCNKILESDSKNSKAWMLKGMAAGWQSSLQNPRFSESVSAFTNAVTYAPMKERSGLIVEAKSQLDQYAKAIISLRGDRFVKWPDAEETQGFRTDILLLLGTLLQFAKQVASLVTDTDLSDLCKFDEMNSEIAQQITVSILDAYVNKITPDYVGDENHPSKYEWQQFIERTDYCTGLLEAVINLSSNDDSADIERYKLMIMLENKAIESCSWTYKYIGQLGWIWRKEWLLSDTAKSVRNQLIESHKSKISEIEKRIKSMKIEQDRIEKEAAKLRTKQYWDKHVSEREALETEKKSLSSQIATLNSDIDKITSNAEKTYLENQVNRLIAEKDALGVFKGKEKRVIQAQIDDNLSNINKITTKIRADVDMIKRKISPLQSRLNAINEELTKAR